MKVAFITNFCTHYRIKTFGLLAKKINASFYFFSEGKENYWQKELGTSQGKFPYKYLPGIRIGDTRIVPTLLFHLFKENYDVYIKCINGKYALPITYIIARIRRKPFILWTGIWMRLQTRLHRLIFPLTRYLYNHSDAIVVYGEHVKQYLISEGVQAERIFVAGNAIDNDLYNSFVPSQVKRTILMGLGVREDQKVILFIGRIEEAKGIQYLIDAFIQLNRKDAVLIIAGSGSIKEDLEQFVVERGFKDRILFPGHIPVDQTITYYAFAWAYVLPSITTKAFKEPWGLVVNEAFNQGLPVITTDAVGAAAGGLIEDRINGFIVPECDSQALARSIQRILDDEPLREQMSHNARAKIAHWDTEHMVAGFQRAIDYVMEKKANFLPRRAGAQLTAFPSWKSQLKKLWKS